MGKSIVQLKDHEFWLRVDENGNVIDNEVKRVDVVVKEIPRAGFAITYLSNIINMIDAIGNKKMKVVKYILSHMDSNNKLSETVREIASGAGVSIQTAFETLKLLEDIGVVARKVGTVMLSPKLVHKGNAQKERYLLTKFLAIKGGEQDEDCETVDVTPSAESENAAVALPVSRG